MRENAIAVNAWSGRVVLAALLLSCTGCRAFDDSLLQPFGISYLSDGGPPEAGARGVPDGPSPIDVPPDSTQRAPSGGAASPDAGAASVGARDASDAALASDAAQADAAHSDAQATGDEDGGIEPPSCIPSAIDDYCFQLPSLAAPAVIDGILDCGLPLLPLAPVGWNGTDALPAWHSAAIAVAWRSDGLYFYAEVRGQTPTPHPAGQPIWCGDAVQLYVDADGLVNPGGSYDAPGAVQFIIAAPSEPGATPEAERFVRGASQGTWMTSALQVLTLSDGYAVEVFVTAADLGLPSWSPQRQLGLNVAIDVAGSGSEPTLRCGLQLGQYFLQVAPQRGGSCNGEPWCDTRAFCTPEL